MPENSPELGTMSPDNSLESAAKRIEGLIFPTKAPKTGETTPDPKTRTEPKKEPVAPEPEDQTPDDDESDETPAKEPEDDDTPANPDDDEDDAVVQTPPQKFKLKVGDEELEVTEDDLKGGYLRNKDYTQKTQKLAAERKEFEEKELAAVRQERQLYAEYLKKLEEVTQPQKVDWDKLRNEVPPDVFAAAYADHDRATKQAEAVKAERQRVEAVQAEDVRKEFAKYVDAENEKVIDAKPEWKDPEKRLAGFRELIEYAREQGIPDNEIRSLTDHRAILLLDKAMQFDKQAKAKPEIRNKIDKVLVDATPGTTRTPSKTKGTKLERAKGRLARSGSVDDAAAAIAHLLD